MKTETIPEDAIEKVKIRDYENPERNDERNLEIIITLDREHAYSEGIENNVLMIKPSHLEAGKTRKLLENA